MVPQLIINSWVEAEGLMRVYDCISFVSFLQGETDVSKDHKPPSHKSLALPVTLRQSVPKAELTNKQINCFAGRFREEHGVERQRLYNSLAQQHVSGLFRRQQTAWENPVLPLSFLLVIRVFKIQLQRSTGKSSSSPSWVSSVDPVSSVRPRTRLDVFTHIHLYL